MFLYFYVFIFLFFYIFILCIFILLEHKFINNTYLVSYVSITTQLSGFGIPPPVGYTKRSQGLCNTYAVIPSADHRIKHSSRRSVFIHSYDMTEPAALPDINMLRNVYVIESKSWSSKCS